MNPGQLSAPAPGQPPRFYQRRSAIPKVMGILMIIFASLGLLGGLIGLATGGTFGNLPGEFAEVFARMKTYNMVSMLIGLLFASLQLVGGIAAVRYRTNAPTLATVYAIGAVATGVIGIIVSYAWMMPALEDAIGHGVFGRTMISSMKFGMVIGGLTGLAWPTVLVVLMNRPAAKAACVNR